MEITSPSTTYNREKPITLVELHEAVQDLRYDSVQLVNRGAALPGAFSLDWMGTNGHFHSIFCRDKSEADIMMLRLRETGFDGDIKDLAPPETEPPPAKKTTRKRMEK